MSGVWRPQAGPQEALLACPALDVGYGGARGGGKTDACIGDFAIHAAVYGRYAKGVFFRREFSTLGEAIARADEIYGKNAVWKGQGAGQTGGNEFVFQNGARLKFRHLKDKEDAQKYQGHAYTRLYFEELTQWPDPAPVDMLGATLRSANGVPVGMRSSFNPGGPGHNWVKARFIDPAPQGYKMLPIDGGHRVFIPAKLSDNKIMTEADPFYAVRLKGSGSAKLVKAWLDGDWNQIEGAYFDEFAVDRHVIKPFAIPASWHKFRAFDWGSAAPFSVGWWAVSGGEIPSIPRGALVCYREWYGSTGEPNKGLKLTSEQVADGIVTREKEDGGAMAGVADPAIFSEDGGPSIAEMMRRRGCSFRPADNKRVAGWTQLRSRLVGQDGRPMIYWFQTCTDSIRTLPALQHDANKAEDLDTDGEDHAADQIRYAVMSRPWMPADAPKQKRGDSWDRALSGNAGGASWKTV